MENIQTGFEIAVIGMSARFPGAKNIDEFWNNLKNGIESISFLSGKELDDREVDELLRTNSHFIPAQGGILENREFFDSYFFAYSPLEAEVMDPQMRILHECAWEALENAAYDPDSYKGLIGIYCGAPANFGWLGKTVFSGKSDEIGSFEAQQLMDKDFMSTRLSYKFNLKGPAIFIQTACSTSLTAIHIACRALLMSECDIALAGGVNVQSLESSGYIFQEGMIISPDGHCRAFDARARGTIGGEGVGIVVLKRLKYARADRDNIYAIVKGSAVDNDGRGKVGYTAPAVEGQARVIKSALKAAQVNPESIRFIEAHGTGTVLGDPIEIEALKRAFNTEKNRFCAVGSVKTNIGHLDAAAGAAGFIKAVLALLHKQIPPSLHFESPNPKIDFHNSPFYVVNKLEEWEKEQYPRRAAVSSFGIGGTNAHVILEEAPEPEEQTRAEESGKWRMILLSAPTENALNTIAANLTGYLKRNADIKLADAAYTLHVGRKRCAYRKMLVCAALDELTKDLTSPHSATCKTHFAVKDNPPVVFMFPGQGSQYVEMGLALYETQPLFRQEMERCFEILKPQVDYDLKEILYPSDMSYKSDEAHGSYIDQTRVTQPMLFVFEFSLARLLMQWGIAPNAMIGHSIGEYVAACLAGVMTLEDALKLVTLRGDLMQELPPGAMLGVNSTEEELIPLLENNISLAAVNSSSYCVLSGTAEAVETIAQKLKAKGYRCRKLHTSHAFHSYMMEPIIGKFEAQVRQVGLQKPKLPYISNITGNWITPHEAVDPAYWAKHICAPVRFEKGLRELLKDETAIFLETGPGNTLSTFARNHRDNRRQFVLNLIPHPQEKIPDDYYLLSNIARLWLYGVTLDWDGYYAHEKRNRVPLPVYPFAGKRYPTSIGLKELMRQTVDRKPHPGEKKDISDWFYIPTWQRSVLTQLPHTGKENPLDILLFSDSRGWGETLAEKLKEKGHEITIVKAGGSFSRENDREFMLNPGEPLHYIHLFDELSRRQKMPHMIVHLWTLTDKETSDGDSEDIGLTLNQGFYSQINICREIKKRKMDGDTRIIVISDNIHHVTGAEMLSPGKAALLGPARVIPQECPTIKYKCIDIAALDRNPFLKERLIDRLLLEIHEFMQHTHPEFIAYRSGRRWIQTYTAVKLTQEVESTNPLRERGVYVITGGLGKIGLTLALYLAGTVHARLVLIARSPFPPEQEWPHWEKQTNAAKNENPIPEKISKIKEIERSGGEVTILSADVSNLEQMQELFAEVEMKIGPINGVIHAAGELTRKSHQCAFEKITQVEGEEQFQAKVYGLLVLEKILRDKKLDFFISMSSLSAVLGGLGFAAYSAANIFMDAYAHQRFKKSVFNWISIDWDGWQTRVNDAHTAEDAILPQEGVQAFQRILSWKGENQIIVSTKDLNARIDRWIRLKSDDEIVTPGEEPVPPHTSRPNISSAYTQPRNETEESIARIWQDFFRLEKIGVLDNFFELGGDSLKLLTLARKIQKQTNVDIPLAELYADPTVAGAARYLENHRRESVLPAVRPIEKREYYQTTAAQKRLYFIDRMSPQDISYNLHRFFIIAGESRREKIETIFAALIARHEAFRTALQSIDDRIVQLVYTRIDFTVDYHRAEETPIHRIIERFIRPFDLGRAPFLRVALAAIDNTRELFMIDMHHVISDMISSNTLVDEFLALYQGKELTPRRLQYKDYAPWESRFFESEAYKKQEKYWLETLSNPLPPRLDLPGDYTRPRIFDFKGRSIDFKLQGDLFQSMKGMMARYETTPYMTFLAFFMILLSKYSGRSDIIVGSPSAGRPHADLEHIIGFFVNMLPMRIKIDPTLAFADFLAAVKQHVIQAFENQSFQFDELIRSLEIKREEGRNPLYDVVFAVLRGEYQAIDDADAVRLESLEYDDETAQSDLRLGVDVSDNSFSLRLTYSTQLFKHETAEKMKDSLSTIIEQALQNNEIKIEKIKLIDVTAAAKSKERAQNIEFNFQ